LTGDDCLMSSTVLPRQENLTPRSILTAVASVDVRRAMVVREDVNPSSCAVRSEHRALMELLTLSARFIPMR